MKFLASVVSAGEAMAVRDTASAIDIKNPSRGALGAPDPQTVAEVRAALGDGVLISAAAGDIGEAPEGAAKLAGRLASAGADMVKVGLHGAHPADILPILASVKEALPYGKKLIAVSYADSPDGLLIEPFELPFIASASGADGMMLDTMRKDGRSLLDHAGAAEIIKIVREARELGLLTGLAGSLRTADISFLAAARPDYIGFRSAITSGRRGEEGVDREKAMAILDEITKISLRLGAGFY